MTRYAVISSLAGLLDFGLALVLLHLGFAPWSGIAIAMLVAGIIDYLMLERWGFSKRGGDFSYARLLESCVVELATYIFRLVLLWIWRAHFDDIDPTDHLLGLAVSYLIPAVFGYLARTRVVFRGRR